LAPGKTRTFIDPDNIGQSGKASQEKAKGRQGRKTLENLRATLQAAREDRERIYVMHYRMQGLRPVSVNTISLAALDVLKQTPNSMKLSTGLWRPTSV